MIIRLAPYLIIVTVTASHSSYSAVSVSFTFNLNNMSQKNKQADKPVKGHDEESELDAKLSLEWQLSDVREETNRLQADVNVLEIDFKEFSRKINALPSGNLCRAHLVAQMRIMIAKVSHNMNLIEQMVQQMEERG